MRNRGLAGLVLAASLLLAAMGTLPLGCTAVNVKSEASGGRFGPVPTSQYLATRTGSDHSPDPVRQGRPARLSADRVRFAPAPTTWKRSALTPNTSRLSVGENEELPLKAVHARVTIDGFRARVLLDCYYHNDRNRQLEGTFKLRLPEGASPYYLAFGDTCYRARDVAEGRQGVILAAPGRKRGPNLSADVSRIRWSDRTNPKEARMVPKEKAAHAYRQTVHVRRVDPALMEWSGAGVFTARVFPILPRRVHRIVIGYDVDLTALGEDLEYRLDLPEKAPNCVAEVSVAAPRGAGSHTTPLAFGQLRDGRKLYRFENPAKRSITVRLPNAGPQLLTGKDTATASCFAAAFRPELPAVTRRDSAARAVFMLDTSLSSNPDKFNVYLKLLKEILARNRDSLREFAVLCFDVSPRWWRKKWTANSPEEVEGLLAYANSLALEGATDLGAALGAAAAPAWNGGGKDRQPCDLFLLSDGGATWGHDRLEALAGALGPGFGGRLFAYRTGMGGTDCEVLAHLARETGGAVFSVVSEDGLASAARAHRSLPWRIERVSIAGTDDLLLAGRPTSIYPGQRLTLAGRGIPAEGAECVLLISRDGERREVKTPLATRIRSELAARVYGQLAVNQLEAAGAGAERAARAYAIHYRVTGRTCSLLMLESEADYARFKIRPEGEAQLVRTSPAGKHVTRALTEARRLRDDPKKAFLDSLDRLAASPGTSFRITPELKAALAAMPAKAFEVRAERLECRALLKRDLPSRHLRELSEQESDYRKIAAEADRRLKRYGAADALRAMSSLVETSPGDGDLVRDVGFTALQWGFGGHAYHLFRRRAAARPENPQNYRAMGLAMARAGRADLAMACFEVVLAGTWDPRFGHVRAIAGLDYLRLLREVGRGKLTCSVPEVARDRLASVSREFGIGGADLLVSVTWNTDATDVDLHVTEPTGETCCYSLTQTKAGGAMTRDVTTGYGPETYIIRGAPRGTYRVRVHYFASDRNRTKTRTRVYATIVTGWGTDHEKAVHKVVTLVGTRRLQDVATVSLGG